MGIAARTVVPLEVSICDGLLPDDALSLQGIVESEMRRIAGSSPPSMYSTWYHTVPSTSYGNPAHVLTRDSEIKCAIHVGALFIAFLPADRTAPETENGPGDANVGRFSKVSTPPFFVHGDAHDNLNEIMYSTGGL